MDKVLIIQDSPSINTMLKFRLESAGFSVDTVELGEDGIKKANEESYQVILLDYRLPKMDGDQVCQILKSQERTKQIPVVFMSAKDEAQIQGIVQAFGAQGYVCLPVDGQELVAKIKEVVSRRL